MEDEETPSPRLRDLIEGAINAYCQQDGFGVPLGFIYMVTHIDSAGEQIMTVGVPDSQMTATSIGMAEYLAEIHRREARAELEASGW